MSSATSPAGRVRLVISDVDGCLTDGTVGIAESGEETKFFSIRDGLGVRLLQRAGIEVALLSGRRSRVVERRADDLGIRFAFHGATEKPPVLDEILRAAAVDPAHACYLGDDLLDLPCLRRVGFPVAVADAHEEVLRVAQHVTRATGGRGAFRELAELILRESGSWESLLEAYR